MLGRPDIYDFEPSSSEASATDLTSLMSPPLMPCNTVPNFLSSHGTQCQQEKASRELGKSRGLGSTEVEPVVAHISICQSCTYWGLSWGVRDQPRKHVQPRAPTGLQWELRLMAGKAALGGFE